MKPFVQFIVVAVAGLVISPRAFPAPMLQSSQTAAPKSASLSASTTPPAPQQTTSAATVKSTRGPAGYYYNGHGHYHGYPYGYYGYYGTDNNVPYDNDSSASQDYTPIDTSRSLGPTSYYYRGRDWGQDLRRDVASWPQFVQYVKDEIVNTVPHPFEDFHRGFVETYGLNAEAAFDKALAEARGEPQPTITPKVIVMPQH